MADQPAKVPCVQEGSRLEGNAGISALEDVEDRSGVRSCPCYNEFTTTRTDYIDDEVLMAKSSELQRL